MPFRTLLTVALASCACTVTPNKVGADTSVVTGAAPTECEPPDGVTFEWVLDPPMTAQTDSVVLSCALGEVGNDANALSLPLMCEGADGQPVSPRLSLWATPPVPRGALVGGTPVTLTIAADGEQTWFRIADAGDRSLIVGAMGERLAPPTGASWWSPFVLTPAATECLADETACDMRRLGIDVQRSGGTPVVVQDANWAEVGDKGEAQVWISAAWSQDATCADEPSTWFTAGLVAAR